MPWNYRVLQKNDGAGSFFAMHEVYYGEAGDVKAFSERPAAVCGDSEQELREVLLKMLEALDKGSLKLQEGKKTPSKALTFEDVRAAAAAGSAAFQRFDETGDLLKK